MKTKNRVFRFDGIHINGAFVILLTGLVALTAWTCIQEVRLTRLSQGDISQEYPWYPYLVEADGYLDALELGRFSVAEKRELVMGRIMPALRRAYDEGANKAEIGYRIDRLSSIYPPEEIAGK